MERAKMAGIGLVMGMLVACGGGADGAAPSPTPTPDAGAKNDAQPPTPAGTNRVTCGAAPYQEIEIQVNQISQAGTGTALKGSAQIVYSGGCDALSTDESGKGYASISLSTSPRSVKILPPAGFVPSIYAETGFTTAASKRTYRVFPDSFKSLPALEWQDTRGYVFVNVVANGTGACASLDGVSLSVEGHPELHATYYRAGTSVDSDAKSTTTYGFASIPNAPPGEKLTILASKPQCNASTLDAAGVGLVPVEAGVVSNTTVTLTDIGGPNCGPGPYVQMTGQVLKRNLDYTSAPLPGATATWSNCPGVTATTREDGSFGVMMTKDTPFSVTLTKAGFIPYRLGELSLANAAAGVLAMREDAWKAYEPGWDDAGVSLYLAIDARGTGPCATGDGVTVSVKNHPEAVAHYLDTSAPPMEAAGATSTTTRGYMELTGLPPGTYEFDLTTTKACKVSATALQYTGKLVALAGHQNILIAALEDP